MMLKIWLDKVFSDEDRIGREDYIWCKSAASIMKIAPNKNIGLIDFGLKLNGDLDGSDVARELVNGVIAGNWPKFRWTIHDKNASESIQIITVLRELDRW